MSNLSDKTSKQALRVLSRTLIYFERLANLDMTAEDAWDARTAENLIKGMIETAGFRIEYHSRSVTIHLDKSKR